MQAVRYRPEIDGLRAVAVLSVIIFHLNNRWLPGGFLGVDIFFVISGFLITNIILSEIQNGSFSFRDFYTRRIKRIYPAFIAAVSLASVIASQIFLYEDFNQMRKTIELSTVFLSNIYLGFRLGYFDLSADCPLRRLLFCRFEAGVGNNRFLMIFPPRLCHQIPSCLSKLSTRLSSSFKACDRRARKTVSFRDKSAQTNLAAR